MKRIRTILIAAALVCAVALAGAWWAIDYFADRQERKLLAQASVVFGNMIEHTLGATLWYAGSMAAYCLDYSVEPKSVEEMQKLADFLYVDELTIVNTNGIAVASNYREYVGFDWHSTPETAAYLDLFKPDNKVQYLMQDFRPCVINPLNYRKFGAVLFTNRVGLVQVGYSMDRLVETMAYADAEAFKRWEFGRYGRFGAYDADNDGISDVVDSNSATATIVGRHRLAFPFAGHMFYAEVPEREFGEERNVAFLIAAVIIILLMVLFTSLQVRLRLSSVRVEKLRAEADRRVAADMQLAHTIQMSTLPSAQAFNRGNSACGLEAIMLPAREVGGDFYDFFTLADGRIAFVIGDVSGKGVPAAMFMLVAKNAIRNALHDHRDAADAIAAANEVLCMDNAAEMFVTVLLAILDATSGEITYVNAGHNRPFVVRADGLVERLDERGGRMLGLFPELRYRSAQLHLEAGDRLFLYTDGVTEAQNAEGHLYGEARLKAVLASKPTALCASVRSDVAKYVAAAPASDDLTMLSIAY